MLEKLDQDKVFHGVVGAFANVMDVRPRDLRIFICLSLLMLLVIFMRDTVVVALVFALGYLVVSMWLQNGVARLAGKRASHKEEKTPENKNYFCTSCGEHLGNAETTDIHGVLVHTGVCKGEVKKRSLNIRPKYDSVDGGIAPKVPMQGK